MNPEPVYGPSKLVGPITFAVYRAVASMNPTSAIIYRADLVELCQRGNVPLPEIYEAVGAGTVEALEQVAAQYGLLQGSR